MNLQTGAPGREIRERKLVLALVGVAALVALAGCGSLMAANGPTVSDPEVVMDEGQPILAFNYSVNDYSTVLLEGPDGQVLMSGEVSPERNRTGFPVNEIEGGEYTIALQQGGETKSTKTIEFDGPDPEIQSVEPLWEGNKLERVTFEVRNTGDVPMGIEEYSVGMRENSESVSYVDEWVPPNGTQEFRVEPGFDGWTVDSGGVVETDISVNAAGETLSESTSREFAPVSLNITDVNQTWDGNSLSSVSFQVRNTGDISTDVSATISRNGEAKKEARAVRVEAHSSETFELRDIVDGAIFTAGSGGNVSFDIVAQSDQTSTTRTMTHEVEGASIKVQSFQPNWDGGVLESVSYRVANTGEIVTVMDASITVNGERIAGETVRLEAGSERDLFTTVGFVPTSGGEYEVALELGRNDGTTSVTETKSFNGANPKVSTVDPLFFSNYGENTSDLSTIEVRLKNEGDIPVRYNAIRYEIAGNSETVTFQDTLPISPSDQGIEYLEPGLTVSDGSYDLTIEVLDDGEVVATRTKTVETDS